MRRCKRENRRKVCVVCTDCGAKRARGIKCWKVCYVMLLALIPLATSLSSRSPSRLTRFAEKLKDPLVLETAPLEIMTKEEDILFKGGGYKANVGSIEMGAMSLIGLGFTTGIIFSLAMSAEEPSLLKLENIESELEIVTRNVIATSVPQSFTDAIAIALGEGIAGTIAAIATVLTTMLFRWRDGLSNNAVPMFQILSDADYFFTRAAALPLFESVGLSPSLASIASAALAVVPYEWIKFNSRIEQLRKTRKEQELLRILLLEEEQRKNKNSLLMNRDYARQWQSSNTVSIQKLQTIQRQEEQQQRQQRQQTLSSSESIDFVEVFTDIAKWLEYDVLTQAYSHQLGFPASLESASFGFLATLSSQLYADVIYLYSNLGTTEKRSEVRNRTLSEWASVYVTKCFSSAALFGVYEAARLPVGKFLKGILTGGVSSCLGSNDYDLCMDTFLVDNPLGENMEDQFRALVVIVEGLLERTGLPLGDYLDWDGYVRGVVVSWCSMADHVLSNFGAISAVQ